MDSRLSAAAIRSKNCQGRGLSGFLFAARIALRYFSAKKQERLVTFISAVSMIGVMIGVAALIVVMAVMNGFHIELSKNIIGLGGDINIYSYDKHIKNVAEFQRVVEEHKFIKHTIPLVNGQGLIVGPRSSLGASLRGIKLEDLRHIPEVTDNILSGNLLSFQNKNAIIIGAELAVSAGLRAGDKVKIVSNNTVSTLVGSMPRAKLFDVVAVYKSGFYEYDSAVIFMNIEGARTLFSVKETDANALECQTVDPSKAELFVSELTNKIGEEYRTVSWQSQNEQFLNALKVERVAMFTILSLIIVVAAFNIVSSQFMLVRDKAKDIAILLTMGASPRAIMGIFIINGSIIGFIGTAFGIILGLGFAENINNIKHFLESAIGVELFSSAVYFLSHLPAKVQLEDVLMISSMAVLLCFLATLYPARRAAYLDPIEVLRYE